MSDGHGAGTRAGGRDGNSRRALGQLLITAAFVATMMLSLTTLFVLVRTSEREADRALEASGALAALYGLNALESTAEAGEAVSPEELARAVVADILATPDEDFGKAAADVVRKFEELYRRLA